MPRPSKGRLDQLAPDKISTSVMIDELRSKIQLAEYEHKATYEKCEQEKKGNFSTLLQERRRNKLRRSSMFSDCAQSLVNVPDQHNITSAFENKNSSEKLYLTRKPMGQALELQDMKVCQIIKVYNLKVHEREERQKRVDKLEEDIKLLEESQERKRQAELNSPQQQRIRVLENSIEKLKMKISSAKLIARHYSKILDNLREDTQNYPWRLDELEQEILTHQRALAQATEIYQESQNLMEKAIHGTKNFHEQYFESKKNRDKMLANTRRDVDKAHREVKGTEKPKVVRAVAPAANPMQEIINKEAEEAQLIRNKYEQQRKKRAEFEGTASVLKNACKVSSKEEILPAITQQHEVQRALKLQIDNLEDQKAALEIEKSGVTQEYKALKYYGEKNISEGTKQMESESEAVETVTQKLKDTQRDIELKEELLSHMEMASNNLFHMLQKYRIDSQARSMMTGKLDVDFAILTEKLELILEQIAQHGKVSDYLENPEFLDFMEDTLPKDNTRVDIRTEDEEGADVFDEESTTKAASNVMTREDIKRMSQKIVERNQGKSRRKKAK